MVLSAEPSTAPLGAPIYVTVGVTNQSNHPIEEWTRAMIDGGGLYGAHFSVIDDTGRVVGLKKADQSLCGKRPNCEIVLVEMGHGLGTEELPPGKSLRQVRLLTESHDINRAGKYKVQAFFGKTLETASVKSNVVTITVTPKSTP